MGVDHGGVHMPMAQKLLYRPDIIPVAQKVGGKAVTKRMTADWFDHPCDLGGRANSAIQTT